MNNNLTIIMFCQVLQTITLLFLFLFWIYGRDERVIIFQVKDSREISEKKDQTKILHCGGSPFSVCCDECEYAAKSKEEFPICFAPDIDGIEKVGVKKKNEFDKQTD